MRMYIYIDRELIKKIAPKLEKVSFDIDFFEYSERRGYTTNNNASLEPEQEKINKDTSKSKKVKIKQDLGVLSNVEVMKRYINIEDISSIKNNNFYYNIIEKIKEDKRLKIKMGKIKNLTPTSFYIIDDKYLIDKNAYNVVNELYENMCEINCIGYKINCLDSQYDVFKTLAIYIE